MDLRKLKTLIDLVAESGISELEITEGEGKVRIVKAPPVAPAAPAQAPMYAPMPQPMPQQAYYAPPPQPMPAAPQAPVAAAPAPAPAAAPVAAPAAPSGNIMKSPMVGTFYRSASPGADPFVQLGQQVRKGEPLCIIEAMKLLNEIESEFDGTVREILVENGQAVEYGQPMFVIA